MRHRAERIAMAAAVVAIMAVAGVAWAQGIESCDYLADTITTDTIDVRCVWDDDPGVVHYATVVDVDGVENRIETSGGVVRIPYGSFIWEVWGEWDGGSVLKGSGSFEVEQIPPGPTTTIPEVTTTTQATPPPSDGPPPSTTSTIPETTTTTTGTGDSVPPPPTMPPTTSTTSTTVPVVELPPDREAPFTG